MRSNCSGSTHPPRVRGSLAAACASALAICNVGAAAAATPDAVISRTCEGSDAAPTPVEVSVSEVPIQVTSTVDDYFVLYVKFDIDDDTTIEIPVAVTPGADGTTALSENVDALAADRYRVHKYLRSAPADVDGDCVDDLTDASPLNPATLAATDGATTVADLATLQALSIKSLEERHMKIVLLNDATSSPSIYFVNSKRHKHHVTFMPLLNLSLADVRSGKAVRIDLTWDPALVAPDGTEGNFHFSLNTTGAAPAYSFEQIERIHTALAANMPIVDENLLFFITNPQLPSAQAELDDFADSRIDLLFHDDVYRVAEFRALNTGATFGRLRLLSPDDRPHPRDVALYETLPNELPRVAGIISSEPQTPLSHVNLRAAQDGIPNAFIPHADERTWILSLVDGYVHYAVNDRGYDLRAATPAEVEAYQRSIRPVQAQTPLRDLSVTAIAPLSQVGFDDSDAFGVKAANVAVLRGRGFPEGTVPNGFAIPFYFYDEFMKANDLYDVVRTLLDDEDFQADYDEQDDELKKLRNKIKDATSPQWIVDALTAMHGTWPDGQSLRYRSSTNNEDLPGFNGAGLYDSKTQKPDETREDGIDKSLKQVYASLWNFRAFTEREFHRIDHLSAAMGVLVHPNYKDELVNGVAVSFDPIYGTAGIYYANSQVGEDLVTNPQEHSTPEEVLLRAPGDSRGQYDILALSSLAEGGKLLLTDAQFVQLRQHLDTIHNHFRTLYRPASGDPFAMEIEFKITSANVLAIKQARPWVFEISNGEGGDPGGGGGGDNGGGAGGAGGDGDGGGGGEGGGGGDGGGGGEGDEGDQGGEGEEGGEGGEGDQGGEGDEDDEGGEGDEGDEGDQDEEGGEDDEGDQDEEGGEDDEGDQDEEGEEDGEDGEGDEGAGPPSASFSISPECTESLCRVRTGVPVVFTDTSSGAVRFRTWRFGDNAMSGSQRQEHAWAKPGFYTVRLTVGDGAAESTASRKFLVEAAAPRGTCEADAWTRCLRDSRYAVVVDWWRADGAEGEASVVQEGTNDSGLFRFFDGDNWEVLIKILDGCQANDHVWVFGASTTDLGYLVRISDTVAGTIKTYRNEPGRAAAAITDVTAFPEGCGRTSSR